MTTTGDEPALCARHISNMLGISHAELAQLVGITGDALTVKRKVDQELRPVAQILAKATEMASGEDRAAIWFKYQPIPGWAGKTAYDLVAEGKASNVMDYLESVRCGVYA
jgi:uncharacterized protein (DUF2384 family)